MVDSNEEVFRESGVFIVAKLKEASEAAQKQMGSFIEALKSVLGDDAKFLQ